MLNVICVSFFAVYSSARAVTLLCPGFSCVLTVVITGITCDITAVVNSWKPFSSVIYKTKFPAGQI